MGLTGSLIRGKDVRRLGIATHFVNEEDLASLENDLFASKNVGDDLDGILAKYDKACEGIHADKYLHSLIKLILINLRQIPNRTDSQKLQ